MEGWGGEGVHQALSQGADKKAFLFFVVIFRLDAILMCNMLGKNAEKVFNFMQMNSPKYMTLHFSHLFSTKVFKVKVFSKLMRI